MNASPATKKPRPGTGLRLNEVTYHQAVLDALDKTLIPNAKNEELKALMVKVRPAFVAHLEHAKQLQASLGKSGG